MEMYVVNSGESLPARDIGMCCSLPQVRVCPTSGQTSFTLKMVEAQCIPRQDDSSINIQTVYTASTQTDSISIIKTNDFIPFYCK